VVDRYAEFDREAAHMTTNSSQQTTGTPAPEGFWKIRHAVIGLGALTVVVLLLMRACGDDESEIHADRQADKPRQAIVVQIPASQWPAPPAPQPPSAPPPAQRPQAAVPPANSNPWAVQTRPRSYGNAGYQQWGRTPLRQPDYVQPSQGLQYRPLESESAAGATRQPQAPVVQQPVPGYRPMAPYDRLSGSSFGTPSYPYGGAYPGYYGPGMYGVPGGGYAPVWPGYW